MCLVRIGQSQNKVETFSLVKEWKRRPLLVDKKKNEITAGTEVQTKLNRLRVSMIS